jgi:hypothetical protein
MQRKKKGKGYTCHSCNFVSLANPESFVYTDIKNPLASLIKNVYSKIEEYKNEKRDYKGNN